MSEFGHKYYLLIVAAPTHTPYGNKSASQYQHKMWLMQHFLSPKTVEHSLRAQTRLLHKV